MELQQVLRATPPPPHAAPLERYLEPFIKVLRCPDVNGAIVASCLSSIAKIVRANFFHRFEGGPAVRALRALVTAVAQCRFESGDSTGDEIAMQRILDVLLLAVRSSLSPGLGDATLCLVVETVFTMCVLPRVSELFRRQAELVCVTICSIVIDRIGEEGFVRSVAGIDLNALPLIEYPGVRRKSSSRHASHKASPVVLASLPKSLREPQKLPSGVTPILEREEDVASDSQSETASTGVNDGTSLRMHASSHGQHADGKGAGEKDRPSISLSAIASSPLGGGFDAVDREEFSVEEQQQEGQGGLQSPPSGQAAGPLIVEREEATPLDAQREPSGASSPGNATVHPPMGAPRAVLEEDEEEGIVVPYTMRTVLALVKHLLMLLSIDEKRNSDRMRSLCLVIFSDTIERHPERLPLIEPIWRCISMHLCRTLVQMLTYDLSSIMVHYHQTLFAVFRRYRRRLIPQTELFVESILDIIRERVTLAAAAGGAAGKGVTPPGGAPAGPGAASGAAASSGQTPSLAVGQYNATHHKVPLEFYFELLTTLVTVDPQWIVDIYICYECAPRSAFLLTDVIETIAMCIAYNNSKEVAKHHSNTPYNLMVALELLLVILNSIAEHAKGPARDSLGHAVDEALDGATQGMFPEPAKLVEMRNLKVTYRESVRLFARDPREALAFLSRAGLVGASPSAREIAQYLRRTPGLDKRIMGEMLASPANNEILIEYLRDFHFPGLQIDEALRRVLESFRLPGESQQISRMMEAFATVYFDDPQHRKEFASSDAVFVLAFSIVMLNTDQHNKQVKKRMTADEFVRNNRRVNDGVDFDRSFLERIFCAIRDAEIVMPEEQLGVQAFTYAWNEQFKRHGKAGALYGNGASQPAFPFSPYAADILACIWPSTVTTLKNLMLYPKTDAFAHVPILAFDVLGNIAAAHLTAEHVDQLAGIIVECLSIDQIIGMAPSNQPGASGPAPTASSGGGLTPASPAGDPGQLARFFANSGLFQVLFQCYVNLFRKHGNVARHAWQSFVLHLLMLSKASLISFSPEAALVGGDSPTDRARRNDKAKIAVHAKAKAAASSSASVGLLSTLTNYLSLTSSAASSSDSALNAYGVDGATQRAAVDFVRETGWEEIASDSRFLQAESLDCVIEAMLAPLVIERPPRWSEGSLVFLVDLIVHTAWHNRDRMSIFWHRLYERFSHLAKDGAVPAVVREHVILGLGKLSLRCADRPDMQREVVQFFQLLCHVPPECFSTLAEPALSIVLRIVELDPPILHGNADIWPHYFTVLSLAGRSKACGPYAFALLTTIVRKEVILFPLDFYSEYVDLLSGFITSSSGMLTAPQSAASSPSFHRLGGGPSPQQAGVSSPLDDQSMDDLASRALNTFALLEANIARMTTKVGGDGEEGGALSSRDAWSDFVIPIHCAVAQQCYHVTRSVRQHAIGLFQRLLTHTEFGTMEGGVERLLDEFYHVLMPLLEELQRIKGGSTRSPSGSSEHGAFDTDEVAIRATSLLSRIFLTNVALIFSSDWTRAEALWTAILALLVGFISKRSACGDILYECVTETIKNMLLVLSSSGILCDPGTAAMLEGSSRQGYGAASNKDDRRAHIWSATWILLEAVMPQAKNDFFAISSYRSGPATPGPAEDVALPDGMANEASSARGGAAGSLLGAVVSGGDDGRCAPEAAQDDLEEDRDAGHSRPFASGADDGAISADIGGPSPEPDGRTDPSGASGAPTKGGEGSVVEAVVPPGRVLGEEALPEGGGATVDV